MATTMEKTTDKTMEKERIEEGLKLFFAEREDGEAIIAELSGRKVGVILEWLGRPKETVTFSQIRKATSLEALQRYVQREDEKIRFYKELREVDKAEKKKKLGERG